MRWSSFSFVFLSSWLATSVAMAQETTFRVDLTSAPAPVMVGDKVDGVQNWEVQLDAAGNLDVTAEVVLENAIEPCVSTPSACDKTENFTEEDPITFEVTYGCADEVDNDEDGMIDTDDPDCQGTQGWSFSIATDNCFGIQAATTRGTVGDLNLRPPGLRDSDGGNFEQTEVVNPDRNGGQQGAVSAVVLSFTNPVILEQTTDYVVARVVGVVDASGLSDGQAIGPCLLRVIPPTETGLRGAGEPVQTAVTVAGETDNPGQCNAALLVRVGEPGLVEICDDEADNDEDGMVDCDDDDCAEFPACLVEICDDEADNDGDGMVDCDDDDCAEFPACLEEICDDGIDNDEDGLIDSEDPDCPALPEDCDDMLDNDQDGMTDCDDPDCAADEACVIVPGDAQTTFSLEVLEPAGTAGNKAGGVVPYEVTFQPPADQVAITVDLHLQNMIEPCVSEPAECDKSENFIEEDPITFELTYGCADEVDNDDDGVTDTDDPDCQGTQGWSLSIATDDCFGVQGATTRGTVGDLNLRPPGLRDSDGGNFEQTEVVNPDRNGGQQGVVSAVVLSFTNPVILEQTTDYVVLKVIGSATVTGLGAGDTLGPCGLRVIPSNETGLRGSGEPVQTAVTVAGETDNPNTCDLAITLRGAGGTAREANFRRGDANDDGRVNIADAVWTISALFREGPQSPCDDMADSNDDGEVDQSDALYGIMYQFDSGPEPPAPFPNCGKDPTPDTLPCTIDAVSSCPQDPL